MPLSLAIGDFAKATHLTVKTLRHYHETGLLEPAAVDPQTGYRRYTAEQIPAAQIIRRFRALDMPLTEIRAVITAPDVQTRNQLIAAHLARLEETLARTTSAVTSLRSLLQGPPPTAARIAHRRMDATPAAAVIEVVDSNDALQWLQGALAELRATMAAQKVAPNGPAGGIYADEMFSLAHGKATVFLPCAGRIRAMGRVVQLEIPAIELATIEHRGPHTNIDIAYGALAAYVAQHALAIEAPLREYYLVGQLETTDQAAWRTEIGWPIFQTQAGQT